MNDQEMITKIEGQMLAEAFPLDRRPVAARAGDAASCMLTSNQWTERFDVQVEGQSVLIPTRLHFGYEKLQMVESDEAWRFVRALQTRSSDGFERQRAARDLLTEIQPWTAPFIVALIGEYIVEILDDISAALTPDDARILGAFIAQNQAHWETTKRRVMSYWSVYYRARFGSESRPIGMRKFHPHFTRDEYVGFRLTERLEAAAFERNA